MSGSQSGGSGLSVTIGIMAIFGCGAFASIYLTNLVRPGASERPTINWSPPSEEPEVALPTDCVVPDAEPKEDAEELPGDAEGAGAP